MQRKEILVFQLREIRNEFADALQGLDPEALVARPIASFPNPIAWIVCHCLRNYDFFLHRGQTGDSLLEGDEDLARLGAYAEQAPGPDNPPPDDLSDLAAATDRVFGTCAELIAALDETALGEAAPHWRHDRFESTAGNCVRVINHSNAHLRQIWLIRGALGEIAQWPVQTLYKRSDSEGAAFYVPDRGTVLSDRARRS
jgi:hypothetical protein